MRFYKHALIAVTALMMLSVSPVLAANEQSAKKTSITNEGIAAVVNDEAITMSDVVERMKLLIASSGMPNNADMQQRMKGQVINMLIEETLQSQEARKLNIKVTPEDIDGGFATIAQNNHTDKDRFKAMLSHEGISLRTMERQIGAQIGWGKVVMRKIRPTIDVTDTDVDSRLQMMKSRVGKTQYSIAEIFLPVDATAQDAETLALAQKLLSEINKNPASFPQIAFQFSQEAASARGGDLGWVQDGDLPDAVNAAVAEMKEGSISQPIRSLTGYHIVLLRGKKAVTETDLPSRDAVLEQIGNERLERAQRRYLSDLKSSAFIDRRV